MNFNIISAYARNKVIGYKNKLPWDIPEDLKRFKKITMGASVIMGRKTYESIGRPLYGRKNIVITNNENFKEPGVVPAKSIESAKEISQNSSDNMNQKLAFVIGGQSIYEEFIDICDKMYITEIDKEVKGDKYFPDFDNSSWDVVESINSISSSGEMFCFKTFQRIAKS